MILSDASIKLSISYKEYLIGNSDPFEKVFVEPALTKEDLGGVTVTQSGLTVTEKT